MNFAISAREIPQVANKSFLYKAFLDLRPRINEPTQIIAGTSTIIRQKKYLSRQNKKATLKAAFYNIIFTDNIFNISGFNFKICIKDVVFDFYFLNVFKPHNMLFANWIFK